MTQEQKRKTRDYKNYLISPEGNFQREFWFLQNPKYIFEIAQKSFLLLTPTFPAIPQYPGLWLQFWFSLGLGIIRYKR